MEEAWKRERWTTDMYKRVRDATPSKSGSSCSSDESSPLKNPKKRMKKLASAVNEEQIGDTEITIRGDCQEDGKNGSFHNSSGEVPIRIRVAGRAKEFKQTVGKLSNEKVLAISDMGFGNIFMFRCSKLNLHLCQMLVDNFDVGSSCMKIHGRHLMISHEDFKRVMNVRDGTCEVDLAGCLDDADIVQLKSMICGSDSEISLDRLRSLVLETESADDIFKISFCLYAIGTLLCPTGDDHVDPRYLLLLREPSTIHSKKWASYFFMKLVERVSSYQSRRCGLVSGCIVFLQLFYLDVVAYSHLFRIVPKIVPPVMTWGVKEAKRIYDLVEESGGFECVSGIYVTKKWSVEKTLEEGGSVDLSTGLNRNVVDDLCEVKSDLCGVKGDVEELKSYVSPLEPDMVRLRNAILTLETSVGKIKSEGLSHIVSEVLQSVVALKAKGKGVGSDDNHESIQYPPTCTETEQYSSKKEECEHSSSCAKGLEATCGLEKQNNCNFAVVCDISNSESYLLTHLFRKNATGDDMFGSAQVARFGDYTVSRRDICCLSPMQCLTSEIVNIAAAYLSEDCSHNWFMSSFFSECAKDFLQGIGVEGLMSYTVSTCRLRTYRGRLAACEKVFVPIHDGVMSHWFLVVMNLPEALCEIWDSNPHSGAKQRREEYARAVVSFFEKVFAEELRMLPMLYGRLTCFSITYKHHTPTQGNSHDSGIFVVRNMQYYGQRWCEAFNSGDQRLRIALEIVNHRKNEVLHLVWAAVAEEMLRTPHSNYQGGENSVPIPNRIAIPDIAGIKFKPHVHGADVCLRTLYICD